MKIGKIIKVYKKVPANSPVIPPSKLPEQKKDKHTIPCPETGM